jgi:ribosomal protein S18 acetylase RimI-like enzyme
MRSADKAAVMGILKDTPEFKPAEVGIAEELIDAYLENPVKSGYLILVAAVESHIAGYVCYGQTPLTAGTWDIYWMAVDRESQGQGIGKRLLAAAEAAIKKSNGRLIVIETSSKPDYFKAQRFYSSRGYELHNRIADFYEPNDDKLTYLKRVG